MYIHEFSGQELHEFLSDGLKTFGVEFEDADMYSSQEVFSVALGNEIQMFREMVEQKYISLENEHGDEIYYYNLI